MREIIMIDQTIAALGKRVPRRSLAAIFGIALVLLFVGLPDVQAQGQGKGRGRGGKHDPEHRQDMATFQFLLRHRDEIDRKVTKLPNGVETITETDDPAVREKLHEHVEAMYQRLEDGRPIHMRDPLFREVFRHADKIEMAVENTDKGLKVTETSDDPYVVRVIQAHAEVVNRFIAHGHSEVRMNHSPPARSEP